MISFNKNKQTNKQTNKRTFSYYEAKLQFLNVLFFARRSGQALTYEDACVVVDHLASTKTFSQSFDLYMQQFFKMLTEQAIGLRTKAVKALTMIVGVDPSILARVSVVVGFLLSDSVKV